MAKQVISIIAVAQTPPPFHGQAVMNQLLLEGDYSKVKFHHVRMAFSDDIQEVGVFRWKKIFHLVAVFFGIVAARFRTGAQVLYYPPASPNMVPFLRDCVLLIGTRWLFKKTVFHFHASGLKGFYERLPWALQKAFRWAYGRPALSISISSFAKADAEFFDSQVISVIPNGIPEPDILKKLHRSSTQHAPEILFCGMVSEEKGVGILLEACAHLKTKGIHFSCTIVGRAVSKADQIFFNKFIQVNQMEEIVQLTGPLHGYEKWKAYSRADVFCFPTFYSAETFPVVAIEAMMFSLPVVATNWRGLPDIVVDGETGFLVPPKDAKSIAERLEHLISDPDLRRTMGAAGRRRYEENFTVEKFRNSMESTLASVGER
jgi:glycosyltransferase involved in cell wall biosynthesis